MDIDHVISFQGVSKTFVGERGLQVHALTDINLNLMRHDFVCLIGPSGCGKSTLLRILAGLERASGGHVFYNGTEQTSPHPEIGMVFQQYALLPWRTAAENIMLGMEIAKMPKVEKEERLDHFLELTQLSAFRNALPHELSGGMQQRVSIARALANDPEVLLMDEPFGALDAYTRIMMQRELLRIWQQDRKTVLFVTHSVDEAIYLADKIVLMSARPGTIKEIIQVDLEQPKTRSQPRFGELSDYILDRLEEEVDLQNSQEHKISDSSVMDYVVQ